MEPSMKKLRYISLAIAITPAALAMEPNDDAITQPYSQQQHPTAAYLATTAATTTTTTTTIPNDDNDDQQKFIYGSLINNDVRSAVLFFKKLFAQQLGQNLPK